MLPGSGLPCASVMGGVIAKACEATTASTATTTIPVTARAVPFQVGLSRKKRMSSATSAAASGIQTQTGTAVAGGSRITGKHSSRLTMKASSLAKKDRIPLGRVGVEVMIPLVIRYPECAHLGSGWLGTRSCTWANFQPSSRRTTTAVKRSGQTNVSPRRNS